MNINSQKHIHLHKKEAQKAKKSGDPTMMFLKSLRKCTYLIGKKQNLSALIKPNLVEEKEVVER